MQKFSNGSSTTSSKATNKKSTSCLSIYYVVWAGLIVICIGTVFTTNQRMQQAVELPVWLSEAVSMDGPSTPLSTDKKVIGGQEQQPVVNKRNGATTTDTPQMTATTEVSSVAVPPVPPPKENLTPMATITRTRRSEKPTIPSSSSNNTTSDNTRNDTMLPTSPLVHSKNMDNLTSSTEKIRPFNNETDDHTPAASMKQDHGVISSPPTTRTAASPMNNNSTEKDSNKNINKNDNINFEHYVSRSHLVNRNLTAFEKQDGVVIVTKLHGMHQIGLLKQSLCLLHFAYNKRVQYDIVVFTSNPLTENATREVEALVHPAKLTVVMDNVGSLQEEIALLTDVKREKLVERCELPQENITWWSECIEPGYKVKPGKEPRRGRLAYNWQAEFRTIRIWRHPALQRYHTMFWMDTDGFPSRKWDRDPIAFFLQNDLTLLMANFGQGKARGEDIHARVQMSFGDNRDLCSLKVDHHKGHLVPTFGDESCPMTAIRDVHGFLHISDLNFYRSDVVHEFMVNFIGDCFLCRKYDDQHAVTIPAAFLRADKAWDMYAHDIKLRVVHNNNMDGKKNQPAGGFIKYFAQHAEEEFPEAYGKCAITEGS